MIQLRPMSVEGDSFDDSGDGEGADTDGATGEDESTPTQVSQVGATVLPGLLRSLLLSVI